MRVLDIIHQPDSYDFIFENASSDEIINDLKQLGYKDISRISGNRVSVQVPGNERNKAIQQLLQQLPNAQYDKSYGGSSLGAVLYKGGAILFKPSKNSNSQGGIKNEHHLINSINKFSQQMGPLSITFIGDNGKNLTVDGVTKAIHVGGQVQGRKKSDVNLLSGNTPIPVSIKKSNAEYWESADSYFGAQADAIVDKLLANGSITLTPTGKVRKSDNTPVVKISPEVAIKATPEQTSDIVFGSDVLEGNGAVVKQTFHDEHYTLNGNQLSITTDLVIIEPADIPANLQVYFIIRNDSTRNRPGSKYPGLRVLGTYASRVRNALHVDPSTL